MSTNEALARPTRVGRVASVVLSPAPLLAVLIVTAVLGSLLGHRIAYALFWALVALVGAVAVIVLAGARPLPRLANRSHLLHRLSWLGRYGTGAVLLCLSTFLGGVAGAAAGEGATATQFEALSALIEEVGAYAIQIAIVLLLGWLAIDMWRLNADQRITGFARVVAWAAGPEPARAISTPVVGRWVRALSSPALVSTIAIIGICYAPTLTKAGQHPRAVVR